ncbi:MAG TPA: helix-turn-helix transcriptional regulator [Acidimicrobiia bacterium]|jgi:transcriptional regulator with XRE-family HTH domain|nr:helix-turn-helix transcriptional regulator [Acidimicrobiia bacterium]
MPGTTGSQLRTLRQASRMSLSDVSARTGISRSQLSDIENGKADPRISTVKRLLECFGADFDALSLDVQVLDLGDLRREGRRSAQNLVAAGLGPSDPEARLRRKEARGVDTSAERRALASR